MEGERESRREGREGRKEVGRVRRSEGMREGNTLPHSLHGPGLGPRAGPARSPWAGPGLNNILRAGPGAGLKLEGPGRARACKY